MKPKLLIVDDDEGLLEGLRLICEDNYDATFVNSGAKAIEEIVRCDYDLVITDLKMPGMSGQETMKAIRELRPTQKIIVMTGYLYSEWKDECVALGAKKFITKAFTMKDFLSAVKEVL